EAERDLRVAGEQVREREERRRGLPLVAGQQPRHEADRYGKRDAVDQRVDAQRSEQAALVTDEEAQRRLAEREADRFGGGAGPGAELDVAARHREVAPVVTPLRERVLDR